MEKIQIKDMTSAQVLFCALAHIPMEKIDHCFHCSDWDDRDGRNEVNAICFSYLKFLSENDLQPKKIGDYHRRWLKNLAHFGKARSCFCMSGLLVELVNYLADRPDREDDF